MKGNLIIIILIGAFFCLCKKEDEIAECYGDDCLGALSSSLTSLEKTIIPKEKIVVKFVNEENDTLKLIFRKGVTERFVRNVGCQCPKMSTNFDGEQDVSIYKFFNDDLALAYVISTTYTGTALNVHISDTNTVIHRELKSTDPCSQFMVYDYPRKKSDYDSLFVENKWYFNIINSFDYVGLCPSSKVNGIFFSKGVGLIKLTYNNKVYLRLN